MARPCRSSSSTSNSRGVRNDEEESSCRAEIARRTAFSHPARIERFGQKSAFRGPPVKALLLRDVVDDNTGQPLTDHVWMTAGQWATMLREGDTISSDARVSEYMKGYFGRREDVYVPPSVDWRFERPTNVKQPA